MYPAERQAAIMALARSGGDEIAVSTMSEMLQVTPETIRRDLNVLERQGHISRHHGGARLARNSPFEQSLVKRQLHEAPEKRAIAERVLQELPKDGAVMLDSGWLPLVIAALFPDDRELIVVTNNLPAVPLLARKPALTVLALPGRIRSLTQGIVDEWTRQRITSLNVDLSILGANGISAAEGVTTTLPDEAEVKQAMLQAGRRRILALTSSKIGRISFCRFANVCDFDMIVTDSRVDDDVAAELSAAGPEVVIV
jgi:DeoR family transcriptional regulator, fructose operon transcriptional repressor